MVFKMFALLCAVFWCHDRVGYSDSDVLLVADQYVKWLRAK